ncbi:hypothetical protein ACPB9J_06035 [Streptomyces lavendulocolor]|uniref:hypothetical protein n=1 Tax=Streptomyces lavendulocolor TaxID=67316 RepID=UPI003C2F5782
MLGQIPGFLDAAFLGQGAGRPRCPRPRFRPRERVLLPSEHVAVLPVVQGTGKVEGTEHAPGDLIGRVLNEVHHQMVRRGPVMTVGEKVDAVDQGLLSSPGPLRRGVRGHQTPAQRGVIQRIGIRQHDQRLCQTTLGSPLGEALECRHRAARVRQPLTHRGFLAGQTPRHDSHQVPLTPVLAKVVPQFCAPAAVVDPAAGPGPDNDPESS